MRKFLILILCVFLLFWGETYGKKDKRRTLAMNSQILDMEFDRALSYIKNERYRKFLLEFKRKHADSKLIVTEHPDNFEVVVIHPSNNDMTGGAEEYFIDKSTGSVKMGWHEHPMDIPLEITEIEDEENFGNSINKFSFDLFKKLDEGNENLFFSPFSIYSSLLMLSEGSGGETLEEMKEVLSLPEDMRKMRAFFKSFLNEIKNDKPYELLIANALWLQRGYKFKENYLKVIDSFYRGGVFNVDFEKDIENSRKTINNWVKEKTNGKIKKLLSRGMLKSGTIFVLTNSIYFKGKWKEQFNPDKTFDGKFKLLSGNDVDAEMMSQESVFNYSEDEKFQVIEMDYLGEDVSMMIFLPKEKNFYDFKDVLNLERFIEYKNSMKMREVKVILPKIKLEKRYFVTEPLMEMGMKRAFSGGVANFSNMASHGEIFVNDIIHKTFFKMGEEGTESAGATGTFSDGVIFRKGEIPLMFMADHPFLFTIFHKKSGAILFMGVVFDPSGK